MESDLSQAFQEELTCFICMSYLTDPVTISCGHSFCRACLHLFWEDSQVPVHCSICREPSQQKDFRTNIVLKKLVSIARQASLVKYLSSEEQQCVTHKETKRIFCMENSIYLCRLCSDSHEHRGHRHCPIEAAAEGQMERLLKQMESLWEKIQENEENLEAEKRLITLWKIRLIVKEEMIRAKYRRWYPLPSKQEEEHIECMKKEANYCLEKLAKSEAMMVQKSKQLREVYRELMAMSQEPYVVLLQDLDDIFRRSESMQLSKPLARKPELYALALNGLTKRFNLFQAGGGGEDRCCRGRFHEYNCTMANIGISSLGAISVIHPAETQDPFPSTTSNAGCHSASMAIFLEVQHLEYKQKYFSTLVMISPWGKFKKLDMN
uniref:tripartite motif-containing protein 43-like n=1 Tax=Myodes glareolus TaxID=447135 RepID=UPI0020215ECC|nr:tripartite motif-containing protein 43-like [Myodes glareolus]